jgi:hypothetical protein
MLMKEFRGKSVSDNKWVFKRKIPFVKLGSAVRFTPKMVKDIIKQSTVDAIP